MRHYGCDDADEIDIVASDEFAPVAFHVRNIELARDFCGVIAARAGNRQHTCALTVLETRNLRGLRKTGADDADANLIHNLLTIVGEYLIKVSGWTKFVDLLQVRK